jgi:hypothetical protein
VQRGRQTYVEVVAERGGVGGHRLATDVVGQVRRAGLTGGERQATGCAICARVMRAAERLTTAIAAGRQLGAPRTAWQKGVATVPKTSKGNFVRRAGLTAAVVAAAAAASAGAAGSAAGTASAESAPASLSDVAAAAQPDSALSAVLARVDAEAGSVTPLGWYLK